MYHLGTLWFVEGELQIKEPRDIYDLFVCLSEVN